MFTNPMKQPILLLNSLIILGEVSRQTFTKFYDNEDLGLITLLSTNQN